MTERFLYSFPKDRIRLRAALLYPGPYSIGMSSLAFQAVYHQLQAHPAVQCERFFAGPGGDRSLESGRSLRQFDAVFITLSFEGDLPVLVRFLKDSMIVPGRRAAEGPLIVVGGIGTVILSGYLRRFADVVVSGDAAAVLPPVLEGLLAGGGREKVLKALEGAVGVYPSYLVPPGTLAYFRAQGPAPVVHSVILTPDTEFPDMGLIEISQGCLYRCAFCFLGCVYGGYVSHPKERVIETAMEYRGLTGRLGLVAATLTNHPDFKGIIRGLNGAGFRLSFSAFRVEGLDDETLEMIMANENRTLVIAPETASDGMKRKIKKAIPREAILEKVRKAGAMGIKRIKLYFLVGLPGETEEDIRENIELVGQVRRASMENARGRGYIPEIIVDINPLVPKPLTDFAGAPMEGVPALKKKILAMKKGVRALGRTFVYGESPKNAWLQYRIANGLMEWEELMK